MKLDSNNSFLHPLAIDFTPCVFKLFGCCNIQKAFYLDITACFTKRSPRYKYCHPSHLAVKASSLYYPLHESSKASGSPFESKHSALYRRYFHRPFRMPSVQQGLDQDAPS